MITDRAVVTPSSRNFGTRRSFQLMSENDLFSEVPAVLPPGLRYQPSLIDAAEARELTANIAALPFKVFEFHGFTGKRKVVSFGWKYDFSTQRLHKIDAIPTFLLPLRNLAANFASLDAHALETALVTEYQPGAAIGWHRDKAVFDQVVGVSFGASCTMRFRRDAAGKWERRKVMLEPGSAYLIAGPARTDWEHSIAPVANLRYSVTYRSMR
jgi:alkylated DNA repair dioxygenase AlkB